MYLHFQREERNTKFLKLSFEWAEPLGLGTVKLKKVEKCLSLDIFLLTV